MTSSRSGPRVEPASRPPLKLVAAAAPGASAGDPIGVAPAAAPAAKSAALRPSAAPAADVRLRPALLARYRDLTTLRYDYPLVLTPTAGTETPVQSLTDIVDAALRQAAPPGTDGERLRQKVLELERQIRVLLAGGATGPLSELWQRAADTLLAGADAASRTALTDDLYKARQALTVDGAVLDCTERTPAAFVAHLWRTRETARARRFSDKINGLILRLRELLRTDFLQSAEARAPKLLQRAFGPSYSNVFDFQVLSKILDGTARGVPLPERRRKRIRAALDVLETQRFVATPAVAKHAAPGASAGDYIGVAPAAEPYAFSFETCSAALEAFHARLPEMAAVIKAMGVAELELDNRYRDAVHDPFFERFDLNSLSLADLAWFPSYLVLLRDIGVAAERTAVLDALSSGLPLKILLQFDDIVEELPLTGGKLAFGRKRPQFAGMVLGLNSAFVLQSSSSHLYRMRQKIQRGVGIEGAALFCVYSGCGAGTAGLPPYLAAAAAVESRAFPTFTYDPTAGKDWAARFDVRDNPQPEADWPVHSFDYEGRDHQRLSERFGFTFADFAACDTRYSARLERIAASRTPVTLTSMADYLQRPAQPGATAFLPLVDDDNNLHKFAAGEELIQATRRCADTWRGLQELGGINNSHARRLLEQQRAVWEQEKQKELQALRSSTQAAAPAAARPAASASETAAPAPAAARGASAGDYIGVAPAAGPSVGAAALAAAEAPAAASDDPYIETPRCTTCEECVQINNRMFIYDENKQAHIADVNAGTYRDLVEAAESCQVSIIHPGKPHNPAEPDLGELLQRAAPFQ